MDKNKELEKEERTIFIVLAIIIMIAVGVLITWYFTKDENKLEEKEVNKNEQVVEKQKKKNTNNTTNKKITSDVSLKKEVTIISEDVKEEEIVVVEVTDLQPVQIPNTGKDEDVNSGATEKLEADIKYSTAIGFYVTNEIIELTAIDELEIISIEDIKGINEIVVLTNEVDYIDVNGKFLIILASSLIVLILLVVGAFYLFDDKDDVFVKSGYVLNPLSSTSEKYYFNENVGYKENLSSMIEFVDVDEKTVSILKDSFVHYMDESISLLKNGAILDLDSVDGKKAVSFYNITNESIIENKGNGYVIESSNGKINLNNFIARISDNKYIVVGDLSLKMVGNDTGIKGDYFEIVYVDQGVVNADGTVSFKTDCFSTGKLLRRAPDI